MQDNILVHSSDLDRETVTTQNHKCKQLHCLSGKNLM